MAKRKSRRYERSQSAHESLMQSWQRKGNTAKNRAYGNYHADCIDTQRELNRVLTKTERRKLFSYWWKDEVEEKKTAYPDFTKKEKALPKKRKKAKPQKAQK